MKSQKQPRDVALLEAYGDSFIDVLSLLDRNVCYLYKYKGASARVSTDIQGFQV